MRPLMWCCSYVFPLCGNNRRMLTLCITNSLFWISTLPLLWKTSGATDTPMGNSSCEHLAHGKMVVQSLLVASSNGMLWHPLRRSVAVACLKFSIFCESKVSYNWSWIFWWNEDVAFTRWKHTNFYVGCLRRRQKTWFSSHFWVSISSSFRKLAILNFDLAD